MGDRPHRPFMDPSPLLEVGMLENVITLGSSIDFAYHAVLKIIETASEPTVE